MARRGGQPVLDRTSSVLLDRESYDIDQSRFQVYVVWADEAHVNEGAVNQVSGSAGSRARGYTLDGEFEQVLHHPA